MPCHVHPATALQLRTRGGTLGLHAGTSPKPFLAAKSAPGWAGHGRAVLACLRAACSPGPDNNDFYGPGYVRELGQFTIPFLLQMGDRKVVHRSNALLGLAYGACNRTESFLPEARL